MIFATSDLHGYSLYAFLDLLRSAGFCRDDFLFVLGDVIDRNGDGGISLLQWMMVQPNVQLIRGNHEDMLLRSAFVFEEISDNLLDGLNEGQMGDFSRWFFNGAGPTITSLKKIRRSGREELENLLDYVREAPLYETVSTDSGDFVLTHAGLGNFEAGKPLSEYTDKELMWHRPSADERYFDGITTVFGHTPTQHYGMEGRAFRTETWIDIDTGAAGGGAPMLLRLDDMKEFYEE